MDETVSNYTDRTKLNEAKPSPTPDDLPFILLTTIKESPPSYRAWSVTTIPRGKVDCSMCTTVMDNICYVEMVQ